MNCGMEVSLRDLRTFLVTPSLSMNTR